MISDLVDSLLPYERPPLVTVVRLDGVIGRVGHMGRGLTLATLGPVLERAFKPKRLAAVALSVNSPGGAPAQSSLIAGRIRALAAEKEIPVFAFCEDVAASGGYWLACAADKIYADPGSIVGSIGVVTSGFGFTELIEKIGVERRLHTAGEHKRRLDPFAPERAEDIKHLKAIQADLHAAFKAMVRARRADRLKAPEETLFSGDFWTGGQALEMGLIDGLGDLRTIMRAEYGDKVKLKPVNQRRALMRLPFGGTNAATPDAWADAALGALEERLARSRFGL